MVEVLWTSAIWYVLEDVQGRGEWSPARGIQWTHRLPDCFEMIRALIADAHPWYELGFGNS